MQITDSQNRLINKAKIYIEKLKRKEINLASSTYCYLICWGESLGYYKLRLWNYGYKELFNLIKIFFKNLYLISRYSSFGLFNFKEEKKYSKLIVSWCYNKDFSEDGTFNDRYFNINSKKTPNTLWLLVSIDNKIPEYIDNNLCILKRTNNSVNILYLFKNILKLIVEKKFSLVKIFHELSFHSFLSKLIIKKIEKDFSKLNLDTVLMPYEAQPFQHLLYCYFKEKNQNIKTIGYLHNMLSPLPTEYFFRTGSPDQLIVHGENQSKVLVKHLLWPKERILFSQSFGFSKKNEENICNVYLPYQMKNFSLAVKQFLNFVKNSPKNSYKKLEVKIHPNNLNSSRYQDLKKKIEIILSQFQDRFCDTGYNEKISVVFGFSSLIMQCLERGNKVVQVSSYPILEVFGNDDNLWEDLEVEKINENVFSYQLKKKSKYINYSNKDEYFKEHFSGF